MIVDWESSPSLIFFGPPDNGQEAMWRKIRPPWPVHELHFPPADEGSLMEQVSAPPRDALGRRRVVAVFGVEAIKPGARRALRALLDSGAFVALFTHAPQSVPEGVWSRCAAVRTPSDPTSDVARSVAGLRARDAEAARRVAAMPAGPPRRAALTGLFLSGLTLAEFLAVLCDGRRGHLCEVAARCQRAALGSVNAIVHAEDFLTHFDRA